MAGKATILLNGKARLRRQAGGTRTRTARSTLGQHRTDLMPDLGLDFAGSATKFARVDALNCIIYG